MSQLWLMLKTMRLFSKIDINNLLSLSKTRETSKLYCSSSNIKLQRFNDRFGLMRNLPLFLFAYALIHKEKEQRNEKTLCTI